MVINLLTSNVINDPCFSGTGNYMLFSQPNHSSFFIVFILLLLKCQYVNLSFLIIGKSEFSTVYIYGPCFMMMVILKSFMYSVTSCPSQKVVSLSELCQLLVPCLLLSPPAYGGFEVWDCISILNIVCSMTPAHCLGNM